jgi:hypothetical protein
MATSLRPRLHAGRLADLVSRNDNASLEMSEAEGSDVL